MLSYRHAFHAGNFADVLKHSTLALVLDYFTEKQKGFSYIDSHSGAGMYALSDDYAQKTGEYKNGIAKLIEQPNLPEALSLYIDIIKQLNQPQSHTLGDSRYAHSTNSEIIPDEAATKADKVITAENLDVYPGSPGIAKQILRRQDAAHLFELHPADTELLTQFCERWNKARVNQSDGYQGVLGNVPAPTRRAVVLIDPPFEIKDDYHKAVNTIIKAYSKFATGCYILWYPVVKRALVEKMAEQFSNSHLRNILQVEYCQDPDNDEYGMTGTGLFIVNPPWRLKSQLNDVLACMKENLGHKGSTTSLIQLVDE